MGTQKNRLNETVLLSTQNTCLNYMDKKIIAILHLKILLLETYVSFYLPFPDALPTMELKIVQNFIWSSHGMGEGKIESFRQD